MKYFIILGLSVAGCVTAQNYSLFNIKYTITDSPNESRIYIKYKNDTGKRICIDPANWPSSHGQIDSGKGRVLLEVSGKIYTTEDFDTGYCPGCFVKVDSGHDLLGFFNYSDFQLPRSDYYKEKVLTFSPTAGQCNSGLGR